jgi:hypothetical protein
VQTVARVAQAKEGRPAAGDQLFVEFSEYPV